MNGDEAERGLGMGKVTVVLFGWSSYVGHERSFSEPPNFVGEETEN